MVDVFQLDYPRKSHLVAERVSDSAVRTECGHEFRQPNGMTLTTFELESDTYEAPVPEARCGNCPWGDI